MDNQQNNITKELLYYEYITLNKNRNDISLKYGISKTKIGVLLQKYNIKRQTKKRHGLSKHPLNIIWCGMKQRCTNPNSQNYKWYGGKGISICDEWKEDFLAFYHWAIKNGWIDGYELDRIDNTKNYCSDNCRWITHKMQCRNRKTNSIVEVNGVSLLQCEWEERLGLRRKVLSKWKYLKGEEYMKNKILELEKLNQNK